MRVRVSFFSYFKDLAGCPELYLELPQGSSLGTLLEQVWLRFPKLEPMRRSTLTAVGVDYQDPDYRLQPGDEVALFPPVQGG